MMPIKVLMSVLRGCTGRSISSIVKELVFNHISRGKKKKKGQAYTQNIEKK